MRKNVDLITGSQIPKKLSSIENRLAALGLDDDNLSEQVNYYKKELQIALEKIERLEKEIIQYKKRQSEINETLINSTKIDRIGD